jgi:hypothetical protein
MESVPASTPKRVHRSDVQAECLVQFGSGFYKTDLGAAVSL